MSDENNQTAAAAAPEKPAKVKQPEQNGVTRPKPGTEIEKIWIAADQLSNSLQRPATRDEVRKSLEGSGINPATFNTQYARWVKFYGVGETLKQARRGETEAKKAESQKAREETKAAKAAERAQKAEAKAKERAEAKEAKAAEKAAKAKEAADAKAEKERLAAEAKARDEANAAAKAAEAKAPAKGKGKGAKPEAAPAAA